MVGQSALLQPATEPIPTRVALVDDDHLFRETLGMNLIEEGFSVTDYPNGRQALDGLLGEKENCDVILLDWRMPEIDGLGVLRGLREANVNTPVIFLTMLSDEIYEEAALKWGAVDFIDKSRRLSIILQRLRLIVSRGKSGDESAANEPQQERLHRGALEIRLDSNRLYWQGEEVDLTLTECTIVKLLAERAGSDVSYREIYDLARGTGFVAGYGPEGYRGNVRSFIKRIRKKFRDLDKGFGHIQNYPGFGYRWVDEPGKEGSS